MTTWADTPFVWDPRTVTLGDLEGGALLSLRGPAGVGKTSLAQRLISERIGAGQGRRTALLNGNRLTDGADLETALTDILGLYPDEEGRWLFIVDEVSHLPGWAKTIATLRQYNGRFRLSSLLAISSSAADLAASRVLLAPWHQPTEHPDRWLGPATFRQYLAARDPDRLLPPTLGIADLLTDAGRAQVERMVPRARRLDEFVLEYARSGGLPRRVGEQLALGAPSQDSTDQLVRQLADTLRGPRRRKVDLATFLGQIATDLGTMTRWGELATSLGLVKTSVSSYIDALTDAFALLVVAQHDPARGGAPSLTRPRKVYFGDTGYAAITTDQSRMPPDLLMQTGGPTITKTTDISQLTPDQTTLRQPTDFAPTDISRPASANALVENLLALALFRAFDPEPMAHFEGTGAIFTWKSVNGREVDFLVDEHRPTPVQSVYGTKTRAKDYESLTKAFGRGLMVSRLVTDTERPVMTVPAGVLLALLDDHLTSGQTPST